MGTDSQRHAVLLPVTRSLRAPRLHLVDFQTGPFAVVLNPQGRPSADVLHALVAASLEAAAGKKPMARPRIIVEKPAEFGCAAFDARRACAAVYDFVVERSLRGGRIRGSK